MTNGLRSGEVAAAAGVNPQTLRYYERRGLLAEPRRSAGGHRLYPAEAVTMLRVVKAAQRLGFTLDEVADLMRAGRHRHGAASDQGLQRRVEAKLAESAAHQIPLNPTVRAKLPAGMLAPPEVRAMQVNWEKAADLWDESQRFLADEFGK